MSTTLRPKATGAGQNNKTQLEYSLFGPSLLSSSTPNLTAYVPQKLTSSGGVNLRG
jgi:hypothetical protein